MRSTKKLPNLFYLIAPVISILSYLFHFSLPVNICNIYYIIITIFLDNFLYGPFPLNTTVCVFQNQDSL